MTTLCILIYYNYSLAHFGSVCPKVFSSVCRYENLFHFSSLRTDRQQSLVWLGCHDLSSVLFLRNTWKNSSPKTGLCTRPHLRQIRFGVRNGIKKIKYENNDNQIKFLKFTVYLYTLKTSENMYTISSTVTFFQWFYSIL